MFPDSSKNSVSICGCAVFFIITDACSSFCLILRFEILTYEKE